MAQFHEALSGAVWLADLELLLEVTDGMQHVRYFRSRQFGRVLVIGDELQHVEAWAPFYHEIIVHLPMSFTAQPMTALVMGGGSLFAAEELLKYDTISEVDLVDHDANVPLATIQAYPERDFILKDRRLKIIKEDWSAFLAESNKKYDIIVNDCTDLYSSSILCDRDLYVLIYDALTDNGVFSDLLYRSLYDQSFSQDALQRLASYPNKAASLLAIPEYPGVFHMLTMWGKNPNLFQGQNKTLNINQEAMQKKGLFKIYAPQFIDFYLYLPPYIRKYLK